MYPKGYDAADYDHLALLAQWRLTMQAIAKYEAQLLDPEDHHVSPNAAALAEAAVERERILARRVKANAMLLRSKGHRVPDYDTYKREWKKETHAPASQSDRLPEG